MRPLTWTSALARRGWRRCSGVGFSSRRADGHSSAARAPRDLPRRIPLGVARPAGWNAVVGPAVFAAVAIALLVYDHVHRQVTDVVFWLSLALVALICVWLVSKTAAAVVREHRKGRVD